MFLRSPRKSPKTGGTPASGGEVLGLDSRQLLTRHAAGDTNAFSELVGIYRAQIFNYLVRAGIDYAMRDDIFQEIFLTIHKAASSYDPRYPLNPWIFTIVVNKVRDHFRKTSSQKLIFSENTPNIPDSSDSADEISTAKQTSNFLEGEIQNLSLDQREVILLHSVRGLEQSEVAEILDIPVATVKSHLRRARAALTQALLDRSSKELREVQS